MREAAMRMLIGVALLAGALAFGQNAEPTREEIAQAYRSKSGEGGFVFPGLRWERWRINEGPWVGVEVQASA